MLKGPEAFHDSRGTPTVPFLFVTNNSDVASFESAEASV